MTVTQIILNLKDLQLDFGNFSLCNVFDCYDNVEQVLQPHKFRLMFLFFLLLQQI